MCILLSLVLFACVCIGVFPRRAHVVITSRCFSTSCDVIFRSFLTSAQYTNYVNLWVPPEMTYGEMVFITCKPTADEQNYFAVVNSIELYHRRKNESNMRMVVKATFTSTTTPENVEWFDRHLEERGKVTGSLGPPETSMFRLRLDNIDCTDEGTFKCVIRDESASGNVAERTRTSTVESTADSAGVYPITTTYVSGTQNSDVSQTAVFAALRDINYTSSTVYPPGSVGLFKCQTSPGFPAPKIRWCIKRPGSSTYQSFHFMSVRNTFQANATATQACLLSSSSLLLLPVTDRDNGTVLSCAVADEECGKKPTNPPISNNNNTPLASSGVVQNHDEILPERKIHVFIGEDKTHIGVNAEENRATDQQVNQSSEDSTMVVLGIAITVMMTGVVLFTVAVVTYFKAKRNKEIGRIKTTGNQYTELDTPRGIHNVHSGVYDAIENLPPDIPATGKPYEVDDLYMVPVE